MIPRIEQLQEKKLVGKHIITSIANNQTFSLWSSFMPRRKEVTNTVSSELISLQVYPDSFDFTFSDLSVSFQKWATVEVTDFKNIPDEMETFVLPAGRYAVFEYKGLNTDTKIFEFIFGIWLPSSKYNMDNRPHFEILGEKYKNNDPNSEEEIWIPIKLKKNI